MKKPSSILLLFTLLVLLSACGVNESDFYGEYNTDGDPQQRYDIKIMDNNKVEIRLNHPIKPSYEMKNGRLEIIQEDVYTYYVDNVLEVFLELEDDDTLLYKTVNTSGEEVVLGSFKHIPGTDGDSGEPSEFWTAVKGITQGVLIVGVMVVIFSFLIRRFIYRE